jgi:hypothetical protein
MKAAMAQRYAGGGVGKGGALDGDQVGVGKGGANGKRYAGDGVGKGGANGKRNGTNTRTGNSRTGLIHTGSILAGSMNTGGTGGGGDDGDGSDDNTVADASPPYIVFRAVRAILAQLSSATWVSESRVALAAMESLRALAEVVAVVPNANHSFAVETIGLIARYIEVQIKHPKLAKHTTVLHTMIVSAYSCLYSWVLHNPTIVESRACLRTLLRVSYLGLTGSLPTDAATPTSPEWWIRKGFPVKVFFDHAGGFPTQPPSTRIQEAASLLLSFTSTLSVDPPAPTAYLAEEYAALASLRSASATNQAHIHSGRERADVDCSNVMVHVDVDKTPTKSAASTTTLYTSTLSATTPALPIATETAVPTNATARADQGGDPDGGGPLQFIPPKMVRQYTTGEVVSHTVGGVGDGGGVYDFPSDQRNQQPAIRYFVFDGETIIGVMPAPPVSGGEGTCGAEEDHGSLLIVRDHSGRFVWRVHNRCENSLRVEHPVQGSRMFGDLSPPSDSNAMQAACCSWLEVRTRCMRSNSRPHDVPMSDHYHFFVASLS